MPIIQEEKFKRKDHKKTKDNITVDIGNFRKELTAAMLILQQTKPSTALKQLAEIGAKVLFNQPVNQIIWTVTENKRKNKRMGIEYLDDEIKAKVRHIFQDL